MRRVVTGILAITSLLLGVGCAASDPGVTREEQLVADSQAVVANMAEGNFAAVEAMFDTTMSDGLDAATLRDLWAQFEDQLGPYEPSDTPPATGSDGAIVIVDVPTRFRDDVLKTRIAWNSDDRIAGLFILVLSAPLPGATTGP